MTQLVSKNPLVLKIVSGDFSQEVLEMLLSKQLPFTDEEYLETLVFLMREEKHKDQAGSLLRDLPESTKANYIEKKTANHRVAYYILLEMLQSMNHDVIAKVIQNQSLPEDFLKKIAQKGNAEMLEMLLANQIKLIAYPEIMDLMEKNPAINKFIAGRVTEIRDYYLNQALPEKIQAEDLPEQIQEVAAKEGAQEETDDLVEALTEEDIQERVVSTLQRINELSVPARIKLALTGTKTERIILIKDANVMVANSVLESPKLSEDEVAIIIRDRSISREIIGKIANKREWAKNYTLTLELVQNPKTPMKRSLSLVRQLHIRDLRQLTTDKNVHYVVRNVAANLLREKTRTK